MAAGVAAVGAVGWTLPALYLLSGAAALILEVTWSRLLSLQFGHTTGATSTVLAAFMGGLAAARRLAVGSPSGPIGSARCGCTRHWK